MKTQVKPSGKTTRGGGLTLNGNERRASDAWAAVIERGGISAPLARVAQRKNVSLNELALTMGRDPKVVRKYFRSVSPKWSTLARIAHVLRLKHPATIGRALVDSMNERDIVFVRNLAPEGLREELFGPFYLMHAGVLSRADFEQRLTTTEGALGALETRQRKLFAELQSYPMSIRECAEQIRQLGDLNLQRNFYRLLDVLADYIPLEGSDPMRYGHSAIEEFLAGNGNGL